MAPTYQLQVITPERIVLEEEVESLVAPGREGYLGVLANHAPLLSSLNKGTIRVRKADMTSENYRVAGGFLEVADNKAVILANTIEAESSE